jgi:hypothetical protein
MTNTHFPKFKNEPIFEPPNMVGRAASAIFNFSLGSEALHSGDIFNPIQFYSRQFKAPGGRHESITMAVKKMLARRRCSAQFYQK